MDQQRRVPEMVDGPDNKNRFAGELLIADAPDVSCLSGVAKPNGRLEPAGVRETRARGLMDRENIDSSSPGEKRPHWLHGLPERS